MPDSEEGNARKWALLIGVNEYVEWPSEYHLKACINDVDAIGKLLTSDQFGFPAENILKLTSPSDDGSHLATRQNIIDAFRDHFAGVQTGDIVVIYYSGHGSFVLDEDGDEEDPYDETLVPCDSGPDHENDIRDDKVGELLDQLAARTQNINLFFDSCHSGTVTRAWQDAEELDAQDRARWLPPPKDVDTVLPKAGGTRSMGPSDWLPLSDGYVVISACHATERARERRFNLFKHHGILTYCLLKALRNVGPETTYYDIWQDVQLEVNRRCRSQHPQLEGAFERKVFGGAALPRKRYVEVLGKAGDAVTLAAGLVHGATVGSRFAIYRQGQQTFEEVQGRVALVKLAGVGAFTSTAALESGDLSQVAVGSPAIEIEHDYGSMQMMVRVVGDAPLLDDVRTRIGASPLLAAVDGDEGSATATVCLRYPIGPDGSRDTARGEMLCILSSGDGHPLVEPILPDQAGAETVCQKLEHIARYYNLLAIRNTDPDSSLSGKVKLRLLKRPAQDGQEEWVPVARDEGGNIVLKVGERIVVEADNQSDGEVHVAVFDCGPNWEVNPIFPPEGASDDRVAAHNSRSTIRFRLEHDGILDERLPPPRETIKLFATTKPVSFRSFWLSSTRAFEEGTDLARLLGLATGGGATRATRSMEGKEEDWTTDELAFNITR